MPKLIVKRKAEVIQQCDLKNSQPSYSIGSEHVNDLKIEDRLISMQHARIERTGTRFFIRDLKSAFGTYINGKRVEDIAELHNGDSIEIGEHSLVFDNPLENVDFELFSEPESHNKTMVQNEGNGVEVQKDIKLDEIETKLRKESLSILRQGQQEKIETLQYQLLTIYGPYKGKRFQLQPETKIGRDDKLNDIVLDKNKKGEPDQSISRRHATIIHKDGSFFVSDKRSKTRTYVNRQVIPEDKEVEIFPNDEIEIVSDQQSTIFRFVEEGNNNFKSPQKAGVWWVRYQLRFITALTIMAVAGGAYFLVDGFKQRSVITQKPDPLTLELTYWSTDKSLTIQSNLQESENSTSFDLVPAVSDFNGDGIVDIATTNITNKPMLIDGQTKLPRWLIDTIPATIHSPLVAADINQNGLDDLIYISNDNRLVAFDGKYGAEIWLSPFFYKELTGPPVIGDFNGDGLNDVAIADVSGDIHIGYNQLLSVNWSIITTGIPVKSTITSTDLDHDGDAELLCGSERGIVFIIDGVSRTILGTIDVNEELNQALGTFYEDNQIRYPIGVAYLNEDKHADIIISTVQGRILAIDGAKKQRLWHDVLNTELTLKSDNTFPFALGDLNGDELSDVITGSNQGVITAYVGKGQDKQSQMLWQMQPESPSAANNLIVCDINKDKTSDILYNDAQGVLWIIDGRTGESLINTGQPTTSRTSMPLAADLQNDGLLDIFLITQTGLIFQYKTNSRIPKGAILWGQKYGRNQNTLTQSFDMPHTLQANISMLFGLLMILGGGLITFFVQRKNKY